MLLFNKKYLKWNVSRILFNWMFIENYYNTFKFKIAIRLIVTVYFKRDGVKKAKIGLQN